MSVSNDLFTQKKAHQNPFHYFPATDRPCRSVQACSCLSPIIIVILFICSLFYFLTIRLHTSLSLTSVSLWWFFVGFTRGFCFRLIYTCNILGFGFRLIYTCNIVGLGFGLTFSS
ncbi:hypothetical protein Hanom_Chr04g00367201 [Helianthus anomalus]